MQVLIFKEWEHWSKDLMGNRLHANIAEQNLLPQPRKLLSLPVLLLDSNCTHSPSLSDYAHESLMLLALCMLPRAGLTILNEIMILTSSDSHIPSISLQRMVGLWGWIAKGLHSKIKVNFSLKLIESPPKNSCVST